MNAFKENITSADFWLRLIYTLLFAVAWQVVEVLLAAILVLQIVFRLFTGEPNGQLAGFGNSLSQYAWQMGRYVTGAAEEKPWPFMEWPDENAEWQPRPAQDPVTVDPAHAAPVPPAAPVVPDTNASVADVTPPPVVEPVVEEEPDAPVVAPAGDVIVPEPPVLRPEDEIDDTDATPGDGSRLKP
ncbi:hypothetical protein DHB74_00050 [Pseudomonas sp. G11-1]|uniref:DUF4389 domain-containing protein n=1 Tax=Halopseudomonas sp. SMJS2 TaxID=3041098 RepID=UPI00245314F4|nr:DUF4389 domain-containing protein [Halopseudomonas sp. SMJS2]MCO5784741.1 hypothetical protein [Pseudomonas sp. G11-1]MCO5789156.1 hypothetical protein [Pseudomonas sp. G11-2]WGK60308.1 DUF4389 domain-containing protein [Halopseudomonas sp. SMJS2]